MAIKTVIENKKYIVRVAYRDTFGRPKDKKATVHGTYKDALLKEVQISEELSNGFNTSMTYKQLFLDYQFYKKNIATDETLRKEREIFEKYLKVIERKKCSKLIPKDILALQSEIEKNTGSITQKNKAIYLFKRILKHGQKFYNYNDHSDYFVLFKSKMKDRFVYHTYTPEEFYFVLNFVTGKNYKLLYEVYYWTGLRRGEALALSPTDVLSTKQLKITKSLNSFSKIGKLKNESSYRNVLIDDNLYNKLLPYAKSKGISLFGGDRYLPPSTVNGRFTRAIIRANKERIKQGLTELNHIRVHDLRHSHATVLASSGATISAISSRLGHSSINETMKTYMHLFKGDDMKVVEIISGIQKDIQN